jgi:hypothetical protein
MNSKEREDALTAPGITGHDLGEKESLIDYESLPENPSYRFLDTRLILATYSFAIWQPNSPFKTNWYPVIDTFLSANLAHYSTELVEEILVIVHNTYQQ